MSECVHVMVAEIPQDRKPVTNDVIEVKWGQVHLSTADCHSNN